MSYGTLIGQTYANLFPRRVRAMVLDGVVDPVAFTTSVQAVIANGVSDTDLVFAKLQSLCQSAGPARCALAGHGSVSARVRRLLARLRRGPIPAPSAGPPHRLSYGDLLIDLFTRLGGPGRWPQLAEGLDQAASGDGSALETRLPTAKTELSVRTGIGGGPPVCRQASAPTGPAGVADGHRSAHPGQPGSTVPLEGWWLWAPCASWPVASSDRYTGPWNASTPHVILAIGTRYDPQTPYANARRVARMLGNPALLTYDGYGHTSENDPSACVKRAIKRSLVALAAPRHGTVCHADHQPFDRGFGGGAP